ncbi:SIS domain-containing protein [Nitratireductor mangrovi]|uniref:SIS domain-containing protein n=1 Tax=Nitratireductor mangrovi TaxID=2599600 RepID=A0A5B8L2Y7_9HYPH|nr:SIS domain-containing protein [Nitratireductor mangrovi]QDZ01908.1 SIS domain-containing protein [Nitratireductor mangrovi]
MSGRTHMAREIGEIPEAAARLIVTGSDALAAAGEALRAFEPAMLATVARGSSDHAASFLKYATEITARIPVASLGPSIASIYGVTLRLDHAATVAISQSGKSPDIVAMTEMAARGGALTIGLTNAAASPLAEACRHAADIMAGPERSVAATKTFVNSALAGLSLLARWTSDDGLAAALARLPDDLGSAISCDWSGLAEALAGHESLFILGRGPSMAIAQEAALKFKETSGVHAEAYSAAEVMHGPLALVKPGFPVLLLAARDAAEPSLVKAAAALAERGAAVFATTDGVAASHRLPFAATGHPLADPLALIASFYAFVEAFARGRGLDPDTPPNLRKVTETL